MTDEWLEAEKREFEAWFASKDNNVTSLLEVWLARARKVPAALQQAPAQEPVAWIQPDHLQKARVAPFLCRVEPTKRMADFVPIYTEPPKCYTSN